MATERSLILLKPDAMERRLTGRIIARFEDKGLSIVGMKLLRVTPELSRKHYAEHVNKPFYPLVEKFIGSGPVVAMVLEGPEAVSVVRAMLGPTNGRQAPAGTIRGDFGLSRQMNLVHASDGPDAAKREIEIYFTPAELMSTKSAIAPWLCASDEA
jgi:nucleoside-diphosphate kinase